MLKLYKTTELCIYIYIYVVTQNLLGTAMIRACIISTPLHFCQPFQLYKLLGTYYCFMFFHLSTVAITYSKYITAVGDANRSGMMLYQQSRMQANY